MDATPPASFGFPRSQRIKHGRDFSRLRLEGRRVVQGCLILNWAALPAATACRLGVITGKKIGHSVIRSRARRLLREAFRLHQPDLNQVVDMVLVARPSIAGRTFGAVEQDYLLALRKARLWRDIPAGQDESNPSVV
jgi:ribonuclease P protein component